MIFTIDLTTAVQIIIVGYILVSAIVFNSSSGTKKK